MNIILLVFINSMLLVTGQTLFKLGVNQLNGFKLSVGFALELITNTYIITGIFLYGFTTVLWLYILSKAELSYVYPLQSIVYIIALFIGVFLFGETVSLNKILGVCIIIIGVFFITKG